MNEAYHTYVFFFFMLMPYAYAMLIFAICCLARVSRYCCLLFRADAAMPPALIFSYSGFHCCCRCRFRLLSPPRHHSDARHAIMPHTAIALIFAFHATVRLCLAAGTCRRAIISLLYAILIMLFSPFTPLPHAFISRYIDACFLHTYAAYRYNIEYEYHVYVAAMFRRIRLLFFLSLYFLLLRYAALRDVAAADFHYAARYAPCCCFMMADAYAYVIIIRHMLLFISLRLRQPLLMPCRCLLRAPLPLRFSLLRAIDAADYAASCHLMMLPFAFQLIDAIPAARWYYWCWAADFRLLLTLFRFRYAAVAATNMPCQFDMPPFAMIFALAGCCCHAASCFFIRFSFSFHFFHCYFSSDMFLLRFFTCHADAALRFSLISFAMPCCFAILELPFSLRCHITPPFWALPLRYFHADASPRLLLLMFRHDADFALWFHYCFLHFATLYFRRWFFFHFLLVVFRLLLSSLRCWCFCFSFSFFFFLSIFRRW